VFHKDQSLVLSYSYSTLFLSVLLSLIRLSIIIYLLMTLNCSSPSGNPNSLPIFYPYKIQLILSLIRCLQIFSHSINLKLSVFLLVYLLNYFLIMLFLQTKCMVSVPVTVYCFKINFLICASGLFHWNRRTIFRTKV